MDELKRRCRACRCLKPIEMFPYVITVCKLKDGEFREYKNRRHTCNSCYNKQTSSSVRKRVTTKAEFNYLF